MLVTVELQHLSASKYRSLRDVQVPLGPLSIFIGANAAGKSNILDALRFLSTGVRERTFATAVRDRGGPLALAWKGEQATQVRLTTRFKLGERTLEWTVSLETPGYGWDFTIDEHVTELLQGAPPAELLRAEEGKGWWWSQEAGRRVSLAQSETDCALAAAAVDTAFPARDIAEFVQGWSFFDPSPGDLRRASRGDVDSRLDPFGRNLATRLRALRDESPDAFEAILAATRNVLGVPESIELHETDDGRVFFRQRERGLDYPVHQVGTSSGTLRMLALMTGLLGEAEAGLVGIEEPENHVHPSALDAFAEHVKSASERVQVLVTTHSPLFLDRIDQPESVFVVRRTADGTEVTHEENPEAVRRALDESGFALGELLQTKGFGA